MKIYTKTGDQGATSLFGGQRMDKSSVRIAAYGTVDELNSLVGTVLLVNPPNDISEKLLRIQSELFVLGSSLASLGKVKVKLPKITKVHIARLEKEIDNWEKNLFPLKNFILPGGGKVGAKLHLARAVCRRAERLMVMVDREEKLDKNLLIYINRLSDWFFVAARFTNKSENVPERIWKGRSKA